MVLPLIWGQEMGRFNILLGSKQTGEFNTQIVVNTHLRSRNGRRQHTLGVNTKVGLIHRLASRDSRGQHTLGRGTYE